jgi:hypothetical protein
MWCLSNICAGDIRSIKTVFNSEIFKKVFEYIKDDCFVVRKEATHVLQNMLSNLDPEIALVLATFNVIELICDKLANPSEEELYELLLNMLFNFLLVSECLESVNEFWLRNKIINLNGEELVNRLTHHEKFKIAELAKNVLLKLNNYNEIS